MKLLIKIGSALISRDNRIDYSWLKTKVDEIAALYREGVRPVIRSAIYRPTAGACWRPCPEKPFAR